MYFENRVVEASGLHERQNANSDAELSVTTKNLQKRYSDVVFMFWRAKDDN
jgi:hypothetical protein